MSETPEIKAAVPGRRTSLFISIAAVLPLLLGYAAGYFVLPGSIQSAYQAKDCDSTLSRYELQRKIYGAFLPEITLETPVMECAFFTLAGREEQSGSQRAAYATYRVYVDTYPDGLFVTEARERGARILLELAREQLVEKNYDQAMGSLDLALSQDSSAAAEVEKLQAQIYQTWGTNLREANDFEGAERVFRDFAAWAQSHPTTDLSTLARRELAQTYLVWGLSLQSQMKFEAAMTKLQLAESTDPEPQSDGGPTAQLMANQMKFFSEWGDYLIEQKDFTGALEKYTIAATLSANTDPGSAQDSIANGYVQWAAGLSAEEDFLGGLVLLDFAQARASSGPAKASVESARSELYAAFSRSGGAQARTAISNALRIVCEHHIPARLPIFGLDQENIRFGVDGTEDQLPAIVAATTPASLHYVACIEEDNRIVQTLRLPISTTTFGGGPGVVQIDYHNYQYVWHVVLRDIATGKEVKETVLEGAKPADLIPYTITATTFNYFGPKPEIADLADWLQTAIE